MLDELRRDPPPGASAAWFESLAETFLNGSRLWIGSVPHRIREVEFYFHAQGHPDPFVHCHPLQRSSGEWYLHRSGSGYRAGTFKGIDLTFGSSGSYGGMLLRSLETEAGKIVNGSGLCVEHMLALTGRESVAHLDACIGARSAFEQGCLVRLEPKSDPSRDRCDKVWSSARVGLTLKRLVAEPRMPEFIMRRYRFLTSPAAIKKGRLQLILAMLDEGLRAEEIHALIASPRHAIAAASQALSEGRRLAGLESFEGKPLRAADYCRLYGALQVKPGSG